MTEPEKPVVEQPAYVPDPEKEKQAKAVHATISILRLLGAIIAVLGIVIVAGRFPQIPPYPGYAMIVLGLAQMWFMPIWIVRNYVKARVAEEAMAAAEEQNNAD